MALFDLPVIEAKPNPLPCAQVRNAEIADAPRATDCRRYNYCNGIADKNGWDGFHCLRCNAYQPPTMEEARADMEPLANLISAIPRFADEVLARQAKDALKLKRGVLQEKLRALAAEKPIKTDEDEED